MISIIIPTYNEEKIVGETLTKLRRKLTLPHEIIVSDDNSTDKTVEIAREFADKVVTFSKLPRLSAGEVRNRGVAVATGEFLVFIDCGSFIEDPDAFFTEALLNFRKKKIVGVSAKVEVLPEIASTLDDVISGVLNNGYWFLNNVIHIGSAWGKFMMVRREAFDAISGFRPDLAAGEDIDFFYRLSKIGRTHFDRDLIVLHPNRRAHQIGWMNLLLIWTRNTLYLIFLGRSYSKEWRPVR
jgi:glycosyltransferase involved in cell wall biosynthesis